MELDKDLQARQEARALARQAEAAQKQLAKMSQQQLDAITEAVAAAFQKSAVELAELAVRLCPPASLLLTTLLEVTRGVQQLAALPLPLALRTALVAGATALGGMAILTQNRTALGPDAPALAFQVFWQAVHGVASFLLALGLMLLWDAGT